MNSAYDNAVLALPSEASDGGTAAHAAVLEAFLREQSETLVAFLVQRVRTGEDAKDAAQESLARFVRQYQHLPPAQWKPVLYRIAANVAIDRLRHARSRAEDRHVPIEDLEIEDERPNAEEAAAMAQQTALLREAVLALPPKCRQVYLLRRVRGLPSADVAERCNISVRMVEKHLANALVHIYRTFGQQPSDTL